ncbi:hypothetical protein TWF696_003381 [Orbilia brochopaga]|uniref:Nephrocystin 3-like N-terminal domain-containing protein n=1 Tax=Orbilia brochopaga TaxID=3140254 RepID=A0AAV9U1R4_9PEZI
MTIGPSHGGNATEPKSVATNGNVSRKTLARCFEDACTRFRSEIAGPAVRQDSKRAAALESFLSGAKLDELGKACKELSEKAGDGVNNAARLWGTLDQFKGAADTFLQFAPESISIVWFGISSLISIANAKVQTRLLICGTCDSIANIMGDCVRWEQRMEQTGSGQEETPKLDIWESDIPELIFSVLDFLWNARPHLDQSRIKRIGSTLKDIFTKELQQKVDAIVEKYQEIVKVAQAHFEESVFHESLRTGLKIDQIQRDLKQYVSIGTDLIDAIQQQALLYELDRQQARLIHPTSYKLHFTSLNDRLNKIIKDRNGRLAANWIFKEDAYVDWKNPTTGTALLCIRGPRGHGKSVAMMSVHREIQRDLDIAGLNTSAVTNARPPLICHFYFKKGEQDIERVRSGLESVLYQLLDARELRQDISALVAVTSILDPSFGESGAQSDKKGSGAEFLDNHKSLCDTIRSISAVIPSRVYIMFDALDECLDRREQEFLKLLLSLIKDTSASGIPGIQLPRETSNLDEKGTYLRVIVSCRDNIDIISEFSGDDGRDNQAEMSYPQNVNAIEITSEKNASDLREFITHDVGELLTRRIDRKRFASFFQQELARIVEIIHRKAKGDFTLARMIIANLQQPSKETLDKRIQQLPSAIGDIYMASLESLTPDEQELVVSALKWVVWGVTGINVIEISDHYRELYRTNSVSIPSRENGTGEPGEQWQTEFSHSDEIHQDSSTAEAKLAYSDPYDDPEIKDIMYHIENAGRDFFKFDRNTGLVSVDISIREWIQEDSPGSKSAIKDSRGFNKYRDLKGNTVFKFTLTPSFVRYGDSLSELFNEREAQMSITVDILRALNNELFKSRYMTWEPEWIPGKPKQQRRYEIDHWQDHIRIMQKWWNENSLDDSWWSELLTQLSIFTRPENWYLWNLQREVVFSYRDLEVAWKDEYMMRLFEEPIHTACTFGLPLMIDMLVRDSEKTSSTRAEPGYDVHKLKSLRTRRAEAFVQKAIARNQFTDVKRFLAGMDRQEVRDLLDKHILEAKYLEEKEYLQYLQLIASGLDSISPEDAMCEEEAPIYDKADMEGRTPLYLAASNPDTLERLLRHGANINKGSLRPANGIPIPGTEFVMQTTLLAILCDLSYEMGRRTPDDNTAQLLLKSAEKLVARAAATDLQIQNPKGATLLHLAAKIRNLQFFKLLCVSGDWDVHAKDQSGQNPMHYLFTNSRPKDPNRIHEVMNICQIMMKMRHSDGDDLVNAEDLFSMNPLAYAVGGGFKEAVELLIKLGADVHDENSIGGNCFHHLASYGSPEDNTEADLAVADILLQAGVNCAKRDIRGATPLVEALSKSKWHIARYLLKIYDEMGKKSTGEEDNPLLARDSDGQTILHYTASQMIGTDTETYANIMQDVVTILSSYTNIQEFVHLADCRGDTALHLAVDSSNFWATKFITTISPEHGLGTRNQSLFNAMDFAAEELARGEWDKRLGLSDDELGIDITTKIFYHLFSLATPSNFSFSFFETKLVRVNNGAALKQLGLEKLVNMCESRVASGDMHGWSLFDMLYAINMIAPFEPYLTQKELSPVGSFAYPSRIGWASSGAELSSNGFNFCLPVEDWEHNFVTVMADHPVPLADRWFYFEIHITEPSDEERYGPGINCKIGVRAQARKQDAAALYTSGSLEIGGRKRGWTDPLRSKVQAESPEGSPSTDVSDLGCGINPITRTMFFTVNGKLLVKAPQDGDNGQYTEGITEIPHARYFPAFTCYSPEGEKFKINFGAERFIFEPANDPNWQFRSAAVESVFETRIVRTFRDL